MLVAMLVALALAVASLSGQGSPEPRRTPFDHRYGQYADLLQDHVVGTQVNYRGLLDQKARLAAVARRLGQVTQSDLTAWTRPQQLAYWINLYNVLTLKVVVDHYPIKSRWFTIFGFVPPNSIKQIPGVWNRLRWPTAGGELTLDNIEHDVIRVEFDEPRIHFAVNCAAIGCPPLRPTPFVGDRLDDQLNSAARDFLRSQHGVHIDGTTLRVSQIFSWYGEDFVERYAGLSSAEGSERDRAILGVIETFGPPRAVRLARSGSAEIAFLDYDWRLNDIGDRSR